MGGVDKKYHNFVNVQRCVKMFLLTSENHPQIVPLPIPKLHYGTQHFCQPFPKHGRIVFALLCTVHKFMDRVGRGNEKSQYVLDVMYRIPHVRIQTGQ